MVRSNLTLEQAERAKAKKVEVRRNQWAATADTCDWGSLNKKERNQIRRLKRASV